MKDDGGPSTGAIVVGVWSEGICCVVVANVVLVALFCGSYPEEEGWDLDEAEETVCCREVL